MKRVLSIFLIVCFLFSAFLFKINAAFAFIKISDLVFDGEPVNPEDLPEILETIKTNKEKNVKKQQRGSTMLLPTNLQIIDAMLSNSKNIQIEIDTSDVLVRTNDDIQEGISNVNFLNAVSEAVSLWDGVDIADVSFLPLKFASGQPDSDDGKNIITFRAVEPPESAPESALVFSIITYARTNTIEFMGKPIMVKPGTILDADIIYDPSNDPCLALNTTEGDIKIGGDIVPISDGGIAADADLSNCTSVSGGDITDLAVRSISHLLGLESSAIASAANSAVGQAMTRYALTNDDRIGLANIYPNKTTLTTHGSVIGKVLLNKKPVKGAHVVLEDTVSGEPVTGGITNIKGQFKMSAVPAGTYNVYAEPLDGPIRKAGLGLNFFGFTADLNFTTALLPDPITVTTNKVTNIKQIDVRELSASAFNFNHLSFALTEEDINASSGAFLLPIRIMPGETLTDVVFWGSNIHPNFGTLTVSGPGITISNVRENKSIPISPFVRCADCQDTPDTMCNRDPRCLDTQEITDEPDELPGIEVDITCDASIEPGPRNIIFTGDQLDPTSPSFGLRDQITGGIIVTED